MSDLPGYDDWKTYNPDDDRCEHCGASMRETGVGWAPKVCTGDCGIIFRDPDAEYDAARDEPLVTDDMGDF